MRKINELSAGTLGRYIRRASYDQAITGVGIGASNDTDDKAIRRKQLLKRDRGITRASYKLEKKARNEEVEQVDELSTHHLARYALRAGEDMADRAEYKGFAQGRGDTDAAIRYNKAKMKRHRGMHLALVKIERRNRGNKNQKTNEEVEQIDEAAKHEALKAQIAAHMDNRYRVVEPDLPRHGNWHHAAAEDHLTDNAHDNFHQHPDYDRKRINLRSIARKVTNRFTHNDSAESRANDKKRERKWTAAKEEKSKPPKKPRFREVWKKTGSHPGAGYHVRKVYREEQELNELSNKTLKSYLKKAGPSMDRWERKGSKEEDKAMSTDGYKYADKQDRHQRNANYAFQKAANRRHGAWLANNKIARRLFGDKKK